MTKHQDRLSKEHDFESLKEALRSFLDKHGDTLDICADFHPDERKIAEDGSLAYDPDLVISSSDIRLWIEDLNSPTDRSETLSDLILVYENIGHMMWGVFATVVELMPSPGAKIIWESYDDLRHARADYYKTVRPLVDAIAQNRDGISR